MMKDNESPLVEANILLVDDEQEIKEMLSMILVRQQAYVDFADNGLEALERCRQKEYDLIVLDLKMPGMDGEGFLKVAQQEFDSLPPIIVQSGHGTITDAYGLLGSYQIADFLEKPVDRSRFVFCVANAIEKRKLNQMLLEREANLREANAYMDSILESMNDALIVITEDGKIQTVNPATCKMLGYSETELLGKSIKKVLEEKEGQEPFLKSGTGEEISVLLAVSILSNKNQELQGIMYLAKDTSELKAAQSQLMQSSKLAALGEMATGVAHEINQPLSYINGLLFDMEEDLEDDVPLEKERTLSDLAEAKRQVRRIADIIQHMRTFGREDNTHMMRTSLNAAVDDALLLTRERLRLKNITLQLELPETPFHVQGNATQLEQVFINLFQNSMDALEGQKNAEITVRMRLTPKKDEAQIEVIDNGAGISDDVRKKIFDPFFTTKGIGKGTGLGLSISHGIMEAHNGSITCKSKEGEGTTFLLRLPHLGAEETSGEVDDGQR